MVPFGVLLLSIAVFPMVNVHFWEHHFPDVAFGLGGIVAGYYLIAFGEYGRLALAHVALEYFQFIALIGSLYIVSGGILIDLSGTGRPALNVAILAFGAAIANLVGTTGASALLIRPFLRVNRSRIQPFHVIFFIFIVSNCGGCLTPIGDPPLFLGFLKGVPFDWPLLHLWPMWLFVNGALLAAFLLLDRRLPPVSGGEQTRLKFQFHGKRQLAILGAIVASVLLDAVLKEKFMLHSFPFGAVIQVVLATFAYWTARPDVLQRNEFSFAPVREVALLFVGIFLTMIPALAYLERNADRLGIETPTGFYFATGLLSAVLDNAPTYLSILQLDFGLLNLKLDSAGMQSYLRDAFTLHGGTPAEVAVQGARHLAAISQGAVFFGAVTYIGNGPNFMVKAIAESSGVRMPSFFGYLKYSIPILLAILILNWALFVRN